MEKSYQKVSGQTALIICAPSEVHSFNLRFYRWHCNIRLKRFLDFTFHGVSPSYRTPARVVWTRGRSHNEGFTSGQENGRSKRLEGSKIIHMKVSLANWTVLKINSRWSRGGQNWTIFVWTPKRNKSGWSSEINVDGPLNWIGLRKSQTVVRSPYRIRIHLQYEISVRLAPIGPQTTRWVHPWLQLKTIYNVGIIQLGMIILWF